MTSKSRKKPAVKDPESQPTMENREQSSVLDPESQRFPSFDSLRAAHSDMLKLYRQSNESQEMEAKIVTFVQKAKATGVLIDIENDRMAAQSLLDYWSTHLFRLGVETPETTLDEFDSSLAPDLPDALCPYRGLNPFSEVDSAVFFGRQRLINNLVEHLKKSRLLCVVGPSGSGKSSAVRAGLIPSLKNGSLEGSQDWAYLPIFMPGSKPLENLAHALHPSNKNEKSSEREVASSLAKDQGLLLSLVSKNFSTPVVVVVDQFEEVFTLCTDDEIRQAFVGNLVNLAQAPGAGHFVILTMRTDFESKVSLLPSFQPLFEQNLVRVMPLNASELRAAVEEPAKRVGLKFEEGVVDALLTDILGEPAALPLLQFTLLRLWDLRDHNRITWESFRRLGGARQALAKSADEFFNKLIPEEQTTARRILLRLVRPGEGLEITSNRLRRSELYQKAEASDRIDRVLDKFFNARLLRLTHGDNPADDQIEVAHEALVRNWPTLVNWLEEERINIRERQRLTTAAERWQSLNQDQAALLRGVLLEEALQYEDLNELETAFLQASQTALDAEKAAEEAARQRELDDACRLAEESEARRKAEEERRKAEEARAQDAEQANRQLNRRNRIITTVGIVALVAAVIAIIAGSSAMYSANQAELAREEALKSYNTAVVANIKLVGQNSTVVAANETAVSGATRVAFASTQEKIQRATADSAKVTATQQQAVIVAATQTVVVQATAQAEAIQYAQQQSQLANTRLGDQAVSIAQSQPDLGLLLAAEAITGTVNFEGQAKILDALRAQPRLRSFLRGSSSAVTQIAFTQTNGNLVSASEDGTIILWDTQKNTILRSFTLQGFAQLNSFAYNAVSGLLAAAGCEIFDFSGRCTRGLIRLTTLEGENAPYLDIPAHSDAITSIAFNPLGNLLVSGGEDGIVFVWNVPSLDSSQSEFTPLYTFNGHDGPVYSVAFNTRGSLMASTGADGKVLVRNLSSLQITAAYIVASPIPIYSLAFTQNGEYLIFGRDDGALLVMDSSTGEIKTQISQHASAILAIASAANGKFIASASKDGSVILWNIDTLLLSQDILAQSPGLLLSAHTDSVHALAFSADSQLIASASRDKSIILWSTTESTPLVITSHTEPSSIQSVSFSPTKDTLWLAQQNGLLAEMNYLDAISGQNQDWEYASPAKFYSRNVTVPLFDSSATLLGLQTGTPPSSRRVLGIDVSEINGDIDWQQIKREGYAFACVKATDGANTSDGTFQSNWVEIQGSGLLRCAYHVFRISDSPEEQAKLFLSTVKLQAGDFPPVLEVFELGSTSSTSIIRSIYTWLTIVEEATGIKPILRTSPNLWSKIINQDLNYVITQDQPPQLGSYPLWVVDYKETSPDIPSGWANWTFWQYTDQGRSTGNPVTFAISRFNGNLSGLQEFITGKATGSSTNIIDTVSVIEALSEEKISVDLPVQNATSFSFNADKTLLAIGLSNGTISIYNPKSAEKMTADLSFSIAPVTSLAFNPVKKELAAGFEDGRLIVIDLNLDPPTFILLSGHIGKVNSLAYTNQENQYGQLLASGGSDGNIFLWDMSVMRTAGLPLRAPSGSAITALAFHPKKLILASGTATGQALLWNVDPSSWKVLACDRAARNLTEGEWIRYFSSQPYRISCPAYPAAVISSSTP
jgi:WD40 repeat protein/energy-coupling factor transporter ATP-binding protein EcfA2